jgi:hypothetical protein
MGDTPATTGVITAPPNTLTAGLSVWTNPLTAFQDIPGALTLLTVPGYQMFAAGALLPIAAVLLLLVGGIGGGGGGGRRR